MQDVSTKTTMEKKERDVCLNKRCNHVNVLVTIINHPSINKNILEAGGVSKIAH
jgi:hypothetical protein